MIGISKEGKKHVVTYVKNGGDVDALEKELKASGVKLGFFFRLKLKALAVVAKLKGDKPSGVEAGEGEEVVANAKPQAAIRGRIYRAKEDKWYDAGVLAEGSLGVDGTIKKENE